MVELLGKGRIHILLIFREGVEEELQVEAFLLVEVSWGQEAFSDALDYELFGAIVEDAAAGMSHYCFQGPIEEFFVYEVGNKVCLA